MTFLEHLNPTEEAQMIRDTATRWAAGLSDEAVRKSNGYAARRWSEMAEMGWHGVLIGDAEGGLGLGAAEVAILAEATGFAKLPEPFIASSVTCAGALTTLSGEAAHALLTQLATGTGIAAPVGFGLPCGTDAPRITATLDGDSLTLNGEVALCELGPGTSALVIYAECNEPCFALLDRDAQGLTIVPYRAVDGRHLARVVMKDARVPQNARLGRGEQAMSARRRADALAIAALCSDAVGTMDRALALTAVYLNEREQFGRKLASFQALRHLTADMMVELEFARSMADLAAFASASPETSGEFLDRARARVCRAAQFVGETAIQLHGGMGMTDEMAIGHYFRRLNYCQALLGQEAGALRSRVKSLEDELTTDTNATQEISQ